MKTSRSTYSAFRKNPSISARGRSRPLTRIRQRCVRIETGTSGAKSSRTSSSVK